MKVLLIVPVYNEELNIQHVYESIKKHANTDMIFINDGSTDHTGPLLDELLIPHIDGISNLGIGGAVQTGYKYALENDYDIAVQFDGDGQHSIFDLERLIEPIVNGKADFCIGSRFIEKSGFQSTFSRRIGIHIISWFIHFLTGVRITDPTSGYRAASKEIIALFAKNYPEEYPEPSTTVRLIKQKKRIVEIPVVMNERQAGKSSIQSWKNAYYMLNVCLSILITALTTKGD